MVWFNGGLLTPPIVWKSARPELLGLLTSGLTASIALEETGRMTKGEKVLVTAGKRYIQPVDHFGISFTNGRLLQLLVVLVRSQFSLPSLQATTSLVLAQGKVRTASIYMFFSEILTDSKVMRRLPCWRYTRTWKWFWRIRTCTRIDIALVYGLRPCHQLQEGGFPVRYEEGISWRRGYCFRKCWRQVLWYLLKEVKVYIYGWSGGGWEFHDSGADSKRRRISSVSQSRVVWSLLVLSPPILEHLACKVTR